MSDRSRVPGVRVIHLLAAAALLVGCGAEPGSAPGALVAQPGIDRVEPSLRMILPGTRLTLHGHGFIGAPAGTSFVVLEGTQAGQPVAFMVEVVPRNGQRIVLEFAPEVLALLPASTGPFDGALYVETRTVVGGVGRSASQEIHALVTETLRPEIQSVEGVEVHPGTHLELAGSGFLLEGEGQVVALVDGVLRTDDGLALRYEDTPVVLEPLSREAAVLRISPDLFGIRPGSFSGSLRLRNEHSSGAVEPGGGSVSLSFAYERPRIDVIEPLQVRRGQVVVARGAGFLEPDPELGAASLILLDGVFRPDGGEEVDLTGPRALILFPDVVHEDGEARVILRVQAGPDGALVGLGARPGIFSGVATPWVMAGTGSVFGKGISLDLRIRPQRQVVYIKLLPGFDDALRDFGLLEVRAAVLARILEVLGRDYAGVNIGFRVERPTDYVEYTVVEVGGRDPNGANLFGLDNTAGKDVGNLRFNDVIGGLNALSEAQGFYAFGGVFVHSFFQFSAQHPLADGARSDPRFDLVFAPVVPVLGGAAAAPGDEDPARRGGEVANAIRVLGNLIGNTITHEVGHALGLPDLEGRFHNEGDNPEWIMDSGGFRPFVERAEMEGSGPEVFSPTSRRYLERILPVEGP